MSSNDWVIYILECSDTTLYTGITNNLEKRIATHNSKKGASYTRGRTPVKLIVSFGPLSKSEALSLEFKIKQLSRKDKILLCQNPVDLNKLV